jgi:hypothetical protein
MGKAKVSVRKGGGGKRKPKKAGFKTTVRLMAHIEKRDGGKRD